MGSSGGTSEFYDLTVSNTSPTPLDLSGAKSVAITIQGDSLYVARDRSMPEGERFLILDMGGDGVGTSNVTPFIINSSDARLWIQTVTTTCKVYVWVVRA
jgi:hypothetical protein